MDKATAVSAVYDLMGRGRGQANEARIGELIATVAKARHEQGVES